LKRSSLKPRKRSRHENEAFARRLADVSADWYWEHDAEDRITFLSPSIRVAIGVDPQTVIGRLRKELRGTRPLNASWEEYDATIEARKPYRDLEYRRTNDTGEDIYYTVSGVPLFDGRGRFKGYRGVGRNITARHRAEQALRESEARFRDLTALSSDWYWEQDEELRFTFISTETPAQADHGSLSSLGNTRWGLPGVKPESGTWDEHRAELAARRPFRDFVVCRTTAGGTLAYMAVSGVPIFDEKKRFKGYRGVGRDITERRTAEERYRYLATHDGLTGLPNRGLFSQLLNVAIEAARRYERKIAVLFIDLDRFKHVNDNFGHEAGDELLKQVSRRFRECLRASDVVARLGGDEFVVMLQEVNEPQDVAAAARKLLGAAIQPLRVLGHECCVTASVGVSLYPADARDEQTLMKNADLAMYQAKEAGKNNCQFYSRAR